MVNRVTDSAIAGRPVARVRVELEGPINFRDLGGLPALGGVVRHGFAFRSDGLHTMTRADVEIVTGRLGLRRVIDLRSEAERIDPGLGLLAEIGLENHHVPLLDQTASLWSGGEVTLLDLYRSMLENSAHLFARAIHLVANADGPVVFHCAAGKDRTGVVAALVLGLLGVDDRDICDDYAASGHLAGEFRRRIEEQSADPRYADRYAEARSAPNWEVVVEEITSARYATMAALLDEIRSSYGTVTSWALEHDVPTSDILALHSRMVVAEG